MEEAMYLSNLTNSVAVVHRRDQLRASKILQERAMKNGKISFAFVQSEGLRRALEHFNSGAMVKASTFVLHVKSLKSRIHEMRRDKGSCHEEEEGRKT